MTKKIIVIALLVVEVAFAKVPLAQAGSDLQLPDAGLTPDSPFYFLDGFFENIQLILTRNPDSKAKLRVKFAQERLSEIDVLMKKKRVKGAKDKSIDKPQKSLAVNLASANQILAQQKQKDQDVSELAREINNTVKNSGKAFRNNAEKRLDSLKSQAKDLSSRLRQANQAGKIAQARELANQLGKIKGEIEFIKARLDSIGETVEKETEKSEEAMNSKDRATELVNDLEEDLAEIKSETEAQGVGVSQILPSGAESTIQEARSALKAGDYQKAEKLAGQAEKTLDKVTETVEQEKEEEGDKDQEVKEDKQGEGENGEREEQLKQEEETEREEELKEKTEPQEEQKAVEQGKEIETEEQD